MPLPQQGTSWPPAELYRIHRDMERWSAWYAGDPRELERVYMHAHRGDRPSNRPSQYRGGLIGAVARTFWGAPRTDLSKPKAKLHIPLAGDICQASADLLFSEPPTITIPGKSNAATNDRLAELVDDGMLSTLAECAEITAALGGGYLRVTWDEAIRKAPFSTSVDADGALPEFLWGHLRAVTFWTVVRDDERTVRRHLERHELDGQGNGVVLHGLYEGTRENLGRQIGLDADDSTKGLTDLVDTASPGLAVTYIPNQRPQRIWRKEPAGVNLGRSDLAGIEGPMDALDETWTSWMRDIRLGKARVFIAQSLLDNLGPGKGGAFDMDQEVFSPLAMLAPRDQGAGLPIQAEQFAIRFEEHDATATALTKNILRTAGYSTQTFGMDSDAAATGAATATEIRARQQRSFMTRDRKVRHWRPALADHIEKLLAVDKAVFGTDVTPARPIVSFPDGVQESQVVIAQTVQALEAARAASTKTKVQMFHPDWTPDQVTAEVTAIHGEDAVQAPDPSAFTGFEPPA